MVKFRSLAGSILCCLLVALGACSSAAKPKVVEKAVEPVTGLHALAQMFSAARGWQADVLVLRINSINAGDIKSMPGRSGVWQGTFVSPTAGQSRHPNENVSYVLELNDRAPDAMWRVYWGTSLASSPYSVLIDAASGDYYRSIQ
jgi:hypothetical protein